MGQPAPVTQFRNDLTERPLFNLGEEIEYVAVLATAEAMIVLAKDVEARRPLGVERAQAPMVTPLPLKARVAPNIINQWPRGRFDVLERRLMNRRHAAPVPCVLGAFA